MKNKILYFIPVFLLLNNSCDKNESDEPKEEWSSIEIDFVKTPIEEPNTLYSQNDLTFMITETTGEDCTEDRLSYHCSEGEIGLYPARLEIGLDRISGISKITVTGNDNCARNCTKFFFYDGNRNVIQSASLDQGLGDFSISFDSGLDNVKTMAISSCEAIIESITID